MSVKAGKQGFRTMTEFHEAVVRLALCTGVESLALAYDTFMAEQEDELMVIINIPLVLCRVGNLPH